MKKTCVAMLLAGGQGSRLKALTSKVAKPAVPFGGKFRIIDFPLSNCVNSGIDTVGVLTQYQPLELNSYIGNGQPWDLDRSDGGVHILPPYVKEGDKGTWYKGTANAIYQNIGFIENYDPENVLILSGDHIYKMDYNKMLAAHMESGADITILYNVPGEGELFSDADRTYLKLDENNRVVDIEVSPHLHSYPNVSMDVYLMDKALLTYLVEISAAHYRTDFVRDVLINQLSELKVYAYKYEGYVSRIESIYSYYRLNMDLLNDAGGAAMGLVNGLCYCVLISWFLRFVGLIIGPDTLSSTLLARFFISIDLLTAGVGI